MPIRFRTPVVGILAILALVFAGCYPFQGDVTLFLTPIAPPDPAAANRALESISTDEDAPVSEDAGGETAEEAAVEEMAADMVTLNAAVAVESLRVRQGASTDTPIIAGLRGGDVVSVVGRSEDGSWLQVQVPDVESIGWVSAEMVTLDGDPETLAVTDGEEMAAMEDGEEASTEEASTEEVSTEEAPAEEAASEEASTEEASSEEAASSEETGGEEATTEEAAMEEMTPSVAVVEQDASGGTVTIAEVVAAQDGFIVIHRDDGGTFGPVIGQAAVAAGTNTDVVVEIDTAEATETLYAMLHLDAGEAGVYEFPGADGPVIFDGAPVSPAFAVTLAMADAGEEAPAEEAPTEEASTEEAPAEEAPAEEAMAVDESVPSVAVSGQEVAGNIVTIGQVVAQEEGWIVIHADDAGTFGPVIGQAPVAPGINTDVTVEIDPNGATDTLYAMLHIDGGEPGVYEFPGPDGPVLYEGAPVSPAFAVTYGAMPVAEAGAGEDEAAATEEGAEEEVMAEKAMTEMMEGDMASQLATVATRSLRLRSAPEADAEILAGANAGEVYPVAGASEDGRWVALAFPGFDKPVWAAASLVELSDISLKVDQGRVTVTTQGARLRLRSGPTVDAPIVGHVLNGQSYPTLGTNEDGTWTLLVGTDVAGPTWASSQFLVKE